MATPAFRDDREQPGRTMRLLVETGAAGTDRGDAPPNRPREQFGRPIPSSAGRYMSRNKPELRVNARKNLEIRDALTQNFNVASPKWTSSSWTPGSFMFAPMTHGEADA
jgi:hypothetical protein